MTKTFQDSIIITRELGLQYLWIDSMRILQGDEEDWTKEFTTMATVYTYYIGNIVTAAAPDGSVGCFFDQPSTIEYGFKTVVRTSEHSQVTEMWSFILTTSNFLNSCPGCFQEDHLAPRSLYFYQDQLQWQCRTLEANEKFPQGIDYNDPSLRSHIFDWHHTVNIGMPTFSPGLAWFKIVNAYAWNGIRFWKDKLPALSGIARVFNEIFAMDRNSTGDPLGQHYLAGLWRAGLEPQLQWKSTRKSPEPCPGHPHHPTWSWVSVYVGVGITPHEACSYEALVALVVLASGDEYGRVRSGSLQLRCHPLVQATV
ncbi:hypothetical protein BCR34DRAFT_644184 [Clohesyomyces aquaticus]|uniref:Heterokaryon incompatibility domain-containing protein n=1 Tax=Clohesyomyces aquaticus TaxID=1231657 RepID=A0A1Y1YBP6_9PLEO|nr:hypothetical protein BCR34DRAFT_644184 [Clohesyomyces aquaticus]